MYNIDKSMASRISKYINLVLSLSCIAIVPLYAYADEVLPSVTAQNRGNVQSNNIPETKKGTVIFRGPGEAAPEEGKLTPQEEEKLSELQKSARSYRQEGVEAQRLGDLDTALTYFQKAADLDPAYAVVQNDLGIIYESKGFSDRALDAYLRAVKIDPDYLSAYTNLALVYENRRDLDKAAYYWAKRAELGALDDPWTQKAKQRLEDIRLVSSNRPVEDLREQEVMGFLKEVSTRKELLKKDNKEQAKEFFEKAKRIYNQGDDLTALKIAIDAKQLDPSNTEIEEFADRIQTRLLSR